MTLHNATGLALLGGAASLILSVVQFFASFLRINFPYQFATLIHLGSSACIVLFFYTLYQRQLAQGKSKE